MQSHNEIMVGTGAGRINEVTRVMSTNRKKLKTPGRVFLLCPLDTPVMGSVALYDVPACTTITVLAAMSARIGHPRPLLDIIAEAPRVCSHLVTQRARA